MVIYQQNLISYFVAYIVQGIVLAIFFILAIIILKRDKKKINLLLASLYISVAIGLGLNFILIPLMGVSGIETFVLILYFFTLFFITFGLIFLVLFLMILFKSEKVITAKVQLSIMILYGLALLFIAFFISSGGVVIERGVPIWSLPFFLYMITVVTIGAAIPIIYYSFNVYREFESSPELKKKFRFFIVGTIELLIFMYITFIGLLVKIPIMDVITAFIGLILIISGSYFIYYGVGKQLEKKKE